VETKLCSKCLIVKEISLFHHSKKMKCGRASACIECDKQRCKIKNSTENYKIKRKIWESNNREKIKNYNAAYHPKYYQENKEKYRENHDLWRIKNLERYRELGRINFQKPSRKLKHKINQAHRRAIKLHATLPGFEEEIKQIYLNCPKGYHVDHIVPLRGKTVNGLHVPWNLQYLTPEENHKKKNKLLP
jgi:5-methylcytosine-specific restriction endonuclease McrA